jgi:hypothetical protein
MTKLNKTVIKQSPGESVHDWFNRIFDAVKDMQKKYPMENLNINIHKQEATVSTLYNKEDFDAG